MQANSSEKHEAPTEMAIALTAKQYFKPSWKKFKWLRYHAIDRRFIYFQVKFVRNANKAWFDLCLCNAQ